MQEKVKDVDGQRRPKIEIAQRAALDLVDRFNTYAEEHLDQTITWASMSSAIAVKPHA